ncbi:MAG: hypothetical protein EXR28_03745 [Betaproteobacteria bacterium]|nr:hypothetical protein [Betaproteobacteria bacterium]
MKTPTSKLSSTSGYGEAPLGVECAFPGATPRLARVGITGASLWRRMVCRFKYGIKLSPAGSSVALKS